MKLFLSIVFLSCLCQSICIAGPPNILLFTADDLHAESLGVYGGKPAGLTPNLDAFAAEGLLFNKAHVNVAICAPCRAVIATGRYSHRSGAMGFMPAREDVPDIVTTLKKAGYLTGILGKFAHSTPKKSMQWDYHFDQKDLGNGRDPDLYYQRSEVFLKRCKVAKKPFYFMVNSHDPHRPYCNPEKLTKGAAMPSRVYSPEEVVVPGFLPDLPGVRAELATYLNSTRRLDDTFGKVMQALEESGEADNTLVLFITDNGIAVPFAKCNAWFHSSRSPLLVRWPGVVTPNTRDDKHFVSVVDLFPTFMAATGVTAPSGLDGRSFLPLLRGQTQERRDHVFTQIDSKAGGASVPMRCVQDENYGYIYNPFSDGKYWYRNNNEGKTMAAMKEAAATDPAIQARVDLFRYRVPEELYNLKNDPDCLRNLIDDPNHVVPLEALRTKLTEQMKKSDDPMLVAFLNRDDRVKVDEVLVETYGPKKDERPKAKKAKKPKGKKRKAKRPNIVMLLADDLGWTGLRSFGSDLYETPNLDRLAESGVKFTNAYSACTVCSPTRASVMTGMYPARLRLTDFIAGQNRPFAKMRIPDWTKKLESHQTTIAETLRDAGYRTGHIGKWHLSARGESAKGTEPTDQGFDVSMTRPPGTKGYFVKPNALSDSGSNYLTDVLTDSACQFIDDSKSAPFFLYFAYHVPHTPIQGREDLVEYFGQKVEESAIHQNATYAAMVSSLDQSVGRILDQLERSGLGENTIIVFTSDNGGLTQRYGKHDGFTENLPLRRGKGSAYEGGVRVPAIVKWPGVTRAGQVCEEPIMTTDYFPTFVEMAGIKQEMPKGIDGRSIVPMLSDIGSTLNRNLYWHYPHYHAGGDGPYSAVRSGNFRFIEFHEDSSIRLYDLANDIGERSDLADVMPGKAAELLADLHRWRASVDAQMPTENPNHDLTRAAQVGKGAR